MARLHALVTVALVGMAGSASAFVFPSPPPGFGGSPGSWTFAPPSGAQQVDSIIRQSQALSVPTSGGTAKLPVGFKLKAAAARVAAAAIFAHPATRAAVGIASWLGTAKLVYDATQGIWREESGHITDGYWASPELPGRTYPTAVDLCIALHGADSTVTLNSAGDVGQCYAPSGAIGRVVYMTKAGTTSCPTGWTKTPAGCLSPAVTQTQFEDGLASKPMPSTVPGELPYPTRLPVEDPVVNPTPGSTPVKQPYFQPTGNPVPNPNFDPSKPVDATNQPFLQPGVRIVPSPTAGEPWRLDLQPVNKPQATDTPAEPGTEGSDDGNQPKPEETQSLCEKHPDILACQKLKLGELDPVELPKRTVPVSIQREEGFGPANGSCPAPKTFTIMGKTMAFRWDLMCDFATGIRPLLIGFAYLSAALAFFGLSRKGD